MYRERAQEVLLGLLLTFFWCANCGHKEDLFHALIRFLLLFFIKVCENNMHCSWIQESRKYKSYDNIGDFLLQASLHNAEGN